MSHAVELISRREPSNVRALLDEGVSKARRSKRINDRRNRREAFPIDCQETRKGLLQNAEATRGHIGRCDDDPMRHSGDVPQGRPIVAEMLEHHDDHREVKRVRSEREAVAVALHTLERTFRAGDTEHGLRGIEGHDAIRHGEELCESAGPRSDVQYALSLPKASDFDESSEPELAVRSLIGPPAIVFCGTSRIVNGHTSCKRRPAYQASEVRR